MTGAPRWLRWLGIVGCLCATACTSCLWQLVGERTNVSGTLSAVVFTGQCGGISGIQVGLTKPKQAFQEAEPVMKILLPEGEDVDAPPYAGAVSVEWLTDRKLLVRYPSWIWPALKLGKVGDVTVEYQLVLGAPPGP